MEDFFKFSTESGTKYDSVLHFQGPKWWFAPFLLDETLKLLVSRVVGFKCFEIIHSTFLKLWIKVEKTIIYYFQISSKPRTQCNEIGYIKIQNAASTATAVVLKLVPVICKAKQMQRRKGFD